MIKTKFFNEGDGGKYRIPAGASPILAVVESVGVDSLVYSLFPFQAEILCLLVSIDGKNPLLSDGPETNASTPKSSNRHSVLVKAMLSLLIMKL